MKSIEPRVGDEVLLHDTRWQHPARIVTIVRNGEGLPYPEMNIRIRMAGGFCLWYSREEFTILSRRGG